MSDAPASLAGTRNGAYDMVSLVLQLLRIRMARRLTLTCLRWRALCRRLLQHVCGAETCSTAQPCVVWPVAQAYYGGLDCPWLRLRVLIPGHTEGDWTALRWRWKRWPPSSSLERPTAPQTARNLELQNPCWPFSRCNQPGNARNRGRLACGCAFPLSRTGLFCPFSRVYRLVFTLRRTLLLSHATSVSLAWTRQPSLLRSGHLMSWRGAGTLHGLFMQVANLVFPGQLC